MDSQTQMKQKVADEAIKEVKNDMILGLGSGSTAALMIKSLVDAIRSGKLQNIKCCDFLSGRGFSTPTDIPLIDVAVSQIDLALMVQMKLIQISKLKEEEHVMLEKS